MRVYCFVIVIATLFLASCNASAPVPTSASLDMPEVAGTYTLATVDGHAVPYAPMHGGQQAPEVAGGSLTLNTDGTFSSEMRFTNPEIRVMGGSSKGNFVLERDEYVLSWEGAGKTLVQIDGDTLTMNNEGMLFVYKK